MKDKILNKLLIIGLSIFILSLFLFVYFFFFKPKPATGLKINLQGPSEVLALEDYEYQIIVENSSNRQLKNVTLKISLSEGAFNSQRPFEKIISFSIGDLNPKEKYQNKIVLFFLNEGDQKENININLNYEIGLKNYIFSKESKLSVLITNSPIQIKTFIPSNIYVNQPFQANFVLTNLSTKKLTNLTVNIEPPASFLLTSAFPNSENLFWVFPSLYDQETKNISIIGQIQDFKLLNTFSVKIDFEYEGIKFSLPKEIVKVNLLESPIVFYLNSQPKDKNIKIGSGSLFYEIILENRSKTILENGEVKVVLDGPFDFSSLNSDGYFNNYERTITWNTKYKNELISINPGDKITFNFSINPYNSYPILSEKEKNFALKIKAEFKTPTIPAEVETGDQKYIIFQEDEKRIIGDIDIKQNLAYNDQYFQGEGPFPLEENKQTILNWHLHIKTIGEDFEDLNISTRFPPYVSLITNKVAGDAVLENLKYNSKTGDFLYTLKNLPANIGYSQKEIELVFRIIVDPSSNTDFNNLVIVPDIQYSAKGSFTNFQINKTTRELKNYDIQYQWTE